MNNEQETKPINLTELAATKIKEAMVQENVTGQILRVSVQGGGCSGLQYSLDFTETSNEEFDFVFEQHGIKIAVDQFSAGHLNGTTIDYVDGLNNSGFKFDNPNAERHCGCGESFA